MIAGGVMLAGPLIAEEKVGITSSPLVVASAVEIINGGSQSVNFSIRPANGVWKTYAVAPAANRQINCTSCSTPYFDFSMSTGGVTVKYKLRPAKRYILRWSDPKKCWDLFNFNN